MGSELGVESWAGLGKDEITSFGGDEKEELNDGGFV